MCVYTNDILWKVFRETALQESLESFMKSDIKEALLSYVLVCYLFRNGHSSNIKNIHNWRLRKWNCLYETKSLKNNILLP